MDSTMRDNKLSTYSLYNCRLGQGSFDNVHTSGPTNAILWHFRIMLLVHTLCGAMGLQWYVNNFRLWVDWWLEEGGGEALI